MSDATTLIRRALNSGIELQFIDGRVKVLGRRRIVESWVPRLRQHKTELIKKLKAPEPVTAEWRELGKVYMAHHLSCETCRAASRSLGRNGLLRCGTGLKLWVQYSSAAASTN